MAKCCSGTTKGGRPARAQPAPDPFVWFEDMIDHCYDYASAAHEAGRPIVGIMCEFTPRELIMAAGGVPVCLCSGSADTIPAAEEHLPANLCPLIKSTFGYHVEKSNPFLEMASLLVAETTCDGKKKMYELLADSRPMYVLELPQKPDDADAFAHWVAELRKLRAELERRFHRRITDAGLRRAIAAMNRERALRRQLAALMKADAPPLTGSQLLHFSSSISCIPADLAQYERAIRILRRKPPSADMARRVRVLMTGVPISRGAEKVPDIIEEKGGLVVCMENCSGIKPVLEDIAEDAADPLLAIAEKYFHLPCSVMTRNERRIESLRALAAEFRPQCIIELIWQACLTYDVEATRVKRLAEEELGIPYLRIETDYSPSDAARLATRCEALFETVRARAQRAGGGAS